MGRHLSFGSWSHEGKKDLGSKFTSGSLRPAAVFTQVLTLFRCLGLRVSSRFWVESSLAACLNTQPGSAAAGLRFQSGVIDQEIR